MNVLITEQQNKIILLEGMSDIMSTIFEHGADFSANLYKRIMKRYKFNLKIKPINILKLSAVIFKYILLL